MNGTVKRLFLLNGYPIQLVIYLRVNLLQVQLKHIQWRAHDFVVEVVSNNSPIATLYEDNRLKATTWDLVW